MRKYVREKVKNENVNTDILFHVYVVLWNKWYIRNCCWWIKEYDYENTSFSTISGSKRIIAPEIVKFFPTSFDRLIEPFAGTCAITILAAAQGLCNEFWINDINEPLVNLMEECINNPLKLIDAYEDIWNGQFDEGENNIDYFYKIREEFNKGKKDSARMLFLLARVVKGRWDIILMEN